MPQVRKSLLRRFSRDEAGAISVMGAMALMLALAVAMIVVDTGAMLSAKRAQQAATDAAALGAVRQLDNVQQTAEAIFALNDYDTGDVTATPVYFVADPSRAPDQRYFAIGSTASDGTAVDIATVNAVRVRMRGESPTYFARLFGFGDMTQIETVSVAALTKHVSFSAGTRLASLNAGIANQVLGGLLGTTLNLSVVDYNALAGTTIDALAFLDALAIRAGLDAGSDTYGDLLGTTVTAGQLLSAAIEVLNGETAEGNPSVAKVALQSALTPVQNGSVPVDGILGATPYTDRLIGSIQTLPGSAIPIDVLELLTGTATVLGEGKAVGFETNVNVGSLAAVNGTIRVGAPMAHMAVGKVGDSVETSQVEVQLTATINTGIAGLVSSQINLPVYIQSASGIATVDSIPCTPGGIVVGLRAQTGAVLARYGTVTDTQPLIATIQARLIPVIGPVIQVLNVRATGSVSAGQGSEQPVGFTQSDIDSGSVRTVSSEPALLSGLGNALNLQLEALPGLGGLSAILNVIGSLVNTITSSLVSTIVGVLTPLDQVLDAVLASVGVKLGSMDMIVHGAKCHAPVLVR